MSRYHTAPTAGCPVAGNSVGADETGFFEIARCRSGVEVDTDGVGEFGRGLLGGGQEWKEFGVAGAPVDPGHPGDLRLTAG